MYSIKGTKDIEFNYNISSIRKISDTEYQYHGKPNSPNLVLSNGIKRISYVADRIEMKQKELIIHHSATSNFSKEAMVIFPLVVSEGRVTTIDRLLGMEMNETLDLDIGSEITDFTMEINETQKSAYVVRLSGGLPISKKPTIIEGQCGLTSKEKIDLEDALTHSRRKGNPHKHKIASEFSNLMNDYMKNAGKCMVGSDHRIKLDGAVVNELGDTIVNDAVDDITSGYAELNKAECDKIGGEMGTPFAGGREGVANGSTFDDSNPEMECFPNEGGVFNKRFHIIYDIGSSDEFIAEAGVKIKADDDPGVKNDKTLREAMKAEVKKLKEHIEKLGGIYVPEATFENNENFAELNNDYKSKYIQEDKLTAPTNDFFTENKPIDIFITYVADEEKRLRRFTGISKKEGETEFTLDGEARLTKSHQAKESILVAVRNDTEHELMNAKQFSADYLNKDFNRYTHISIPGYMTETENQSMKAIMAILLLIFASLIAYYTIPGFYKIAIEKITGYSQDCKRGDDVYGNYYLATAFNYLFAIITILIPLIMMLTSGVNAVLSGIMILGIIFMIAIYARHTIDRMFFHSFYPRERGQMCNKTKAFRESEDEGSRFKVFKYIPSAFSAFTSRNTSRKVPRK